MNRASIGKLKRVPKRTFNRYIYLNTAIQDGYILVTAQGATDLYVEPGGCFHSKETQTISRQCGHESNNLDCRDGEGDIFVRNDPVSYASMTLPRTYLEKS